MNVRSYYMKLANMIILWFDILTGMQGYQGIHSSMRVLLHVLDKEC